MVQVDIFWAYGLSSGLTLAAAQGLKKEDHPFINKYFVAILLWIAVMFAPSGMYLLWEFPSWETMFVALNHNSIPGWLVVLFGVTNITQGILGYWITYRLIMQNKMKAARMQTIWSHAAMFFILFVGWDGTGFMRFTHTGTAQEFADGVRYPWTNFFTSPVAITLIVMGVFLIPTYIWLIKKFQVPNEFMVVKKTKHKVGVELNA